MNTNDYDRIIEMYLDGALSPVEEREFRALLEIDPQLKSLFDAELAVRATFEEDAEAVPVETERSYARFLAALSATAPAGGVDGGAGAAPSPRAAGSWMPAGIVKLAATAVMTLGLLSVGYLAVVDRDGSDATSPATRTTPAATTAPSSIDLSAPAARSAEPLEATTPLEATAPGQNADVRADGATQAHQPSSRTSASERTAASSTEASRVSDGVARPETKAIVDPHDDLTEINQRSSDIDDLPVIESDSVNTRVKLRMKGR